MKCLAKDRSRRKRGTEVRNSQRRARRVFAAYTCLLAVGLLFAPYAGAAWMSHTMNCCTGDRCAVPQHHHHPAPTPAHADCDHDSSGGLTACTMSCCQDQDRPFATAMAFVMPTLMQDLAPRRATEAVRTPRSIEIPRSIQPLLPPPRTVSVVL